MQQQGHTTDEIIRFYRDYYRQDILTLANEYPKERESLYLNWGDIANWNNELAERYLTHHSETQQFFEQALAEFDLPADIDLSGAHVRLTGLNQTDEYYPSELTKSHTGYVCVSGNLGQVTSKDEVTTETAFECERCGTMTYIPQTPGDFQEPHECQGCERQGPFSIVDNQTQWEDYCQIRIETPPGETGSAQSPYIDGIVLGDIVHAGGEYGLIGRAGDEVKVYGTVERKQKMDGRTKTPRFQRYLNVEAIEFPNDDDDIDIASVKHEFEELASREDAVDIFADSIVPELYQTDEWETALEWAVAYLFAAPRVDVPDGPTFRGDIHGAIISDFGMAKSLFSYGVELYSPGALRRSATSLSSDVGLTVAAVRDDFGDGQWSLKPGLLARADQHLILDEIDKGPDDLESINDALEGKQEIHAEKAGMSATYDSKVGVLVLGNPKEGRFDRYAAIAPQIGVDSSFLSRFDGIITMQDIPDELKDENVADTTLNAYAEAQQKQYGDLEQFDTLSRVVTPDVGRAWVKFARENINPIYEKKHNKEIREWYAREVRQLNNSFAEENGEGKDMPVPASARVIHWVVKFSIAFARCELREKVTEDNIERAKKLAKRLVSQNWDGEKFDASKTNSNSTDKSQAERRDKVKEVIRDYGTITYSELAAQTREDYATIKNDVNSMPEVNILPNNKVELK